MLITNFEAPEDACNFGYSNVIVEGHAEGGYLKECYDRCNIANDAAEVLTPDIGTDFDSVYDKTDATFYTTAHFETSCMEGTEKELSLLLVIESEDLGWFERTVPLSDDERKKLSEVPQVRELFASELTELAENKPNEKVSMTIGNTKVIVCPDSELPDIYQVVVRETDTDKWILDTGDIHIDDLKQVIMNFAEFDNDIKNLEGTTAENYLRETAKNNDKEIE